MSAIFAQHLVDMTNAKHFKDPKTKKILELDGSSSSDSEEEEETSSSSKRKRGSGARSASSKKEKCPNTIKNWLNDAQGVFRQFADIIINLPSLMILETK
ncbi:WSSV544 [White spot syndrome virus]|uniref:WSSV544 n=1 Tax=White spot syndrome virus TaxID=342409 RepID=A0A2I6SCI3_9VIRU|nr:WSSV544 [White spot syndrome virus]